jgi:hypothetical protein
MLAACGGDDESPGTTESGSTSSSSGSSSSSETAAADESSTGGIPEACPDVALQTGIVGQTDLRTCDILAGCVMPEVGVPLAVYATNPQVGGSSTGPGALDPEATPIESIMSGVVGRFAFQLPSGTYFVCATSDDGVLCSAGITLSEDDPVVFASYEGGTQFQWSSVSCGL